MLQPRDINANLEWLQQQRTHMGASAVILTSTVSGQGLQELMLAINAMLERRQRCVDMEHRTAVEEGSTAKAALGHQHGVSSMASRAA